MESEPLKVRWVAALVLLCAGTMALQFRHIERSVPYPRHVDEAFISGPAHRTVVTGTLHPYTFYYPSLPKYLAASGMAIGFVRGAANREIREIQRLGNVGYPYYENPRPMQTARQLFVVLAAIALIATGAAAWLAFQTPVTLLLAPLILIATPLFFFHSWTYLNVDIVATCFVMLTIAATLAGTRHPSLVQSALIPGVCAGLATGSKYTLAVVILPVLAGIWLHVPRGRRLWTAAAALAAMTVAFIAAVPYCLVDIPGFLNGLAAEAFHYASGHRGFQGEPGVPQLLYYAGHLASEFGVAGLVLAFVGFVCLGAADWRRALVVAALPVALLGLLASQRVHFPRNVLALQPLIAMLIAFGVVCVYRWVMAIAWRRMWLANGPRWLMPTLLGGILIVAAVPWWHMPDHFRDRTDSRNAVQVWIEERLPPNWTIVVPRQLGLDTRRLAAKARRIAVVDLQSARDPEAVRGLLSGVPGPAVILAPRWGADSRFPGHELPGVLNELSSRWRVMKTFGTNDVLVNYSYPNPWGDPAFAVAVLE